MAFQFKQFSVQQDQTTQKVGTDSLLLACLAPLKNIHTVLDIGTGSGLIALVYAQRHISCTIQAIEPNLDAASEAQSNFQLSPWKERLNLDIVSLQSYVPSNSFDLIISNPPYYAPKNYSKSANTTRHSARYQENLTFMELIDHSLSMIHSRSKLYFILPTLEAKQFIQIAKSKQLHLIQQIHIQPHFDKPVNRIILGFSLTNTPCLTSTFIIRKKHKNQYVYTRQYKELLAEFLLFL